MLGWRKEKQRHANRTERYHKRRADQTPKSMPYMERGQLFLNSILLMFQLRSGCQPPPSWKGKKFLVVYHVTFSQSYLSMPPKIACPLLPLQTPYKPPCPWPGATSPASIYVDWWTSPRNCTQINCLALCGLSLPAYFGQNLSYILEFILHWVVTLRFFDHEYEKII